MWFLIKFACYGVMQCMQGCVCLYKYMFISLTPTIAAAVFHLNFPALFSRRIRFSFHMELSMDTGHDHWIQSDVAELLGPSQPEHTLGQRGPESVQVTCRVWVLIPMDITIVCIRQSNPQQLKTRLDCWRHFHIPQINVAKISNTAGNSWASHITLD